jgi:uncharacterized protein YodC (DUF2158 family)
MEQFRIRDIVVLKSGGPVMTVTELDCRHGRLEAYRWYEGKEFVTDWLPVEGLKVADDSDSGIATV